MQQVQLHVGEGDALHEREAVAVGHAAVGQAVKDAQRRRPLRGQALGREAVALLHQPVERIAHLLSTTSLGERVLADRRK